MTPRTITITVADYQRLEQKWLVDLATARRESVVFERRIGELEAMLDEVQARHDDVQTKYDEARALNIRLNRWSEMDREDREGIET